jgi:hypothetical protein
LQIGDWGRACPESSIVNPFCRARTSPEAK